MRLATLLALGLAASPVRLEAQPFGRESVQCSADATAIGVINGRLIPLSDSIFVNRGVMLAQGDAILCQLSSDSTGAFEFRAVPAGTYRVEVAGLGLQPLAPISVHVGVLDSVFLTIPVHAPDEVSECMREPSCAPVLARATSAERQLSPDRSLAIAAHRVGIALSREAWGDANPVACVSDDLAQELIEVFDVVPASECASSSAGEARRRLYHTPTGRPAVGITVDGTERTSSDLSVIHVSYVVASLWAAGFRCVLRLEDNIWTPSACRLTWVS